ncbi:MAG TPA: hypothetical protein VFV30_01885 [Novosphingobium sp.]|nr:hypothetical protein [Novosphingobium sp.]
MHIDRRATAAMLCAAHRADRRTPWAALLKALLELAGNQAELISHAERAWASVTFSGTRHHVRLRFVGAHSISAGERFIDALPDHEFSIPRQLVADAAVLSVTNTVLPEPCLEVEVQLLLLEDA